MVVSKPIPVRKKKAVESVLNDKEIVRKLLVTTVEMQQPVRRNTRNTRMFYKEQVSKKHNLRVVKERNTEIWSDYTCLIRSGRKKPKDHQQ